MSADYSDIRCSMHFWYSLQRKLVRAIPNAAPATSCTKMGLMFFAKDSAGGVPLKNVCCRLQVDGFESIWLNHCSASQVAQQQAQHCPDKIWSQNHQYRLSRPDHAIDKPPWIVEVADLEDIVKMHSTILCPCSFQDRQTLIWNYVLLKPSVETTIMGCRSYNPRPSMEVSTLIRTLICWATAHGTHKIASTSWRPRSWNVAFRSVYLICQTVTHRKILNKKYKPLVSNLDTLTHWPWNVEHPSWPVWSQLVFFVFGLPFHKAGYFWSVP